MAIQPSDFTISLSPDPVGIVVGMNSNVSMSFTNTNTVDRGYNLSAELILPDGVSFVGSTITPTSVVSGPNGTIIVSWTNIKDLAPNEVDFQFQATVQADETFRETGESVPFDVPISAVVLNATVDTLPRGNDDPGNEEIPKTDSSNYIPLRYSLTKTAPSKMPKGAGLFIPETEPLWPYEYTLTVMNNSRMPSTVTLVDNLPNGVRYLDNLSVSGPDAAALSSPTVTIPSPGPDCQSFVTLDWGTVTLSENSINVITFEAAIWDNYTVACEENTGERIPHTEGLTNVAVLDGLSGPVEASTVTNAMDAVIYKSVASETTEVGQLNHYTLNYRINQYDDIDSFVITDTIGNGQSYEDGSASIAPSSVTVNADGTTELVWNLGLQSAGSSGSITFNTTTDASYSMEGPVSADDALGNVANINGFNPTSGTTTPDSSQASIMVTIPSITKELLGYYYEDGTAKSYDVAAPGDEVEFRITYSSIGLNAQQRDIEIDEYAPENMGPLTAALPVTYGGTLPGPFAPVTVSPNGLRWSLGTLPGDTLWTATFKVPVQDIEFTGARNNLAKLAGSNTEEFAYSDRDQVEVLFGEPNIEFEKTVSGPDVTAIKAGEIYTYSITVSNPQNEDLTVTDAFEMDLTDVIPDNLAYNGVFSVTGTGTHTTPVFSGQNVSMTISQLAPGESLTFSYEVVVEPTVVAGSTLVNEAVLQRPYSQPSRSYQFPGDPFTDSAVLNTEGLVISKLITPVFAKIGDTVTYILQVTVPEGTAAYNVQTVDVFPDATQDYIVGSATKDGVPIVPTVSGGTVTFPTVPFVDASEAEVTMIYSFKVRITGGTFASPYISYQTDYATVSWDIDDQGTPADPFTTSEVLQVRTPSLTATKEQRNATTGGNFTTSLRSYTPGDVIQYRISVQNNGTETAYDSVITDVIDPLLSYVVGSITVTNGSAAVTGGTLVWNIPEIAASGTAVLTFSVDTLAGVASNGRITNNATYIYNTNNNGFGFLRGPFTTNTVQLRSPSARITKTASLSEGEIGDDITYTITVTVPENTIAYTPTVSDILPVGQTYIGPATRQQLPLPAAPIVPTVSGQNITFPVNPDITAVGGDVTIIYTFTARITDATHAQPYEETQTDSARVEWAIQPGGSLVRSSNTSLSITARTPHITILKEQRNDTDGGSYTTANISALPGDVVHYRFTITSDGASPAYNINLNDVLSDDLSYSGIVAAPTVGTVTPPAAPPDATLVWNIPQLDSGQSATLEFAVIVNSGIGAFSAINDLASATYDSNDVNPVTYPAASNQVTIDIPALEFVKSASTTTAAIGDTITYTLTVEIPDGVVAYNLELKDEIPVGQEYVPGSWSPGIATSTPNEVIYNEPVTPIVGPQTLVFTFDTVVVSGRQTPPYTQIQPNRARLTWDLTPDGPMAPAVLDTIDIEVLTPHITARKEQRNVTQGGGFTTDPLIGVATNDTVEYRITLENDGAGTAYNIVTSDTLDPSLTYTGVVTPPPGTVVSSVSPGDPDGTITWTESTLSAGASVVLVFSVLVNAGPAPGTAVSDQTSTVYDTALVNPSTLGPTLSNQVAFNFNNPVITKAIDKESAFVGDTVTYTVSITIPNGNIAYDVQVSDMLPAGQSYVSESLTRNGVPVSSPTLTFPSEGTIDATAGEVTIVYTFDAVIDSIASSPQEEQINSSTIEWNIAPGGPAGTPQNAEVGVFVTDSSITVEKQQRNFTTGVPASFTTAPVDVSVGDVVYYQFTVTNPSANTIYNVSIDDVLSPYLQFNGSVTPPAAGIITHTGGTVNWSIDSIPAFTSYSAVFAVTVLPGASAQSTIENTTSATFTATATSPVVVYGPTTFNTVELILPFPAP